MSLNDILQQVLDFKKENSIVWFRGHRDQRFKLNSGLYRIDTDSRLVLNYENNLLNAFLNYGDHYCNQFKNNTEWNAQFLMQHYGLYTRLLDWTDSFVTALYFAIKNYENGVEPCIWMLNPQKLNQNCQNLYSKADSSYAKIGLLTLDTLPESIKDFTNYYKDSSLQINTFAILPRRSNERLVSQNGFFTVQGTMNVPLEEEYKNYVGDFIQKIIITESLINECQNFIALSGINYYSLYGGPDGLCQYIKNELFDIKLNNL